MTQCVAGHTGAGQSLSSGQEYDGLDSLSRQASPPVSPGMYQVSAHGSRLVRESVASRTMVMIPMGLRLQHQQLGCKQSYQVDLATGLQQQVQGHRRWYLVVDGTVLLWQQQQGRRNGYLVCTWLRQQKGRRPARDASRLRTPREDYTVVPELQWQWQQVKGHRQARPCRPSTQAKHSELSTSNGRQNYSVTRPHISVGRVPGTKNGQFVCGTNATQCRPMDDLYVVPKPCSVGLVPGMAITDGYHPIRAMTVFNIKKLSKTIQRFGHGMWL